MAISFPMPLADFFDTIPIQSATFDLGEAYEYSQTGAGEILTADLGPRLWKADIKVPLGSYARVEQIKAKLNVLRQAGRSLFVTAIPLQFPQYDPTGSILGSSVIRFANVSANNREISLTGFPSGYKLNVGDKICFPYGSNPVRYAMHEVVTGKTASAAGLMTNVEVGPFIRPSGNGFSDIIVILKKPFFKAVIVPGSVSIGATGGRVTDGVSFSLIQTLR